jgi:hypothetical protein
MKRNPDVGIAPAVSADAFPSETHFFVTFQDMTGIIHRSKVRAAVLKRGIP